MADPLHPGQRVILQGLVSASALNGCKGIVQVPVDDEMAAMLAEKGRVRVRLDRDGRFLAVSTNNVRPHRPFPTMEYIQAIQDDLASGEMPMPLSKESLRGGMESAHHGGNPKHAAECAIECNRCGNTNAAKYVALERLDGRKLLLECTACVPIIAAEAKVPLQPQAICRFVEKRYMGSCEACSVLAGYSVQSHYVAGGPQKNYYRVQKA